MQHPSSLLEKILNYVMFAQHTRSVFPWQNDMRGDGVPVRGGQNLRPCFLNTSFQILHFEGCFNVSLEVIELDRNINMCNGVSMQRLGDHIGNKCTCVCFYLLSFILGEVARSDCPTDIH